MSLFTGAVLPLALFILSQASPTNAQSCQDLTLSVPLTATNVILNLAPPASNVEVTDFVLNLTQAGANFGETIATGTQEISGTYTVGGTLCSPASSGTTNTLQILSHGIGFTRSYWDYPDYSYVAQALSRGYSTFAYDRLGSGASRHSSRTGGDLDPINELQSSLEVALLTALTQRAREDGLGRSEGAFERVLHVGHSLGSISIYGAVRADPELSDGIALTGFTPNGSYVPWFQFASNFLSAAGGASGHPNGYVTFSTPSALQTNQFGPGGAFDSALLEPVFGELQPTALASIVTLGGPLSGLNGFEGPVIDVTGSRDLPFCGGNCETADPSLPAQVGALFPNSTNFSAVVIPGGGHALNLHFSRDTTYAAILDFFDGQST